MNVLQQLQAGVRVEFNEAGRFLRILASELQDKIRVQFYRNGAMICEALEVGRGFSETMEDGNFDSYAVTSSVTQNVNIVTRAGSKILYDTPPVGDVNVLSLPPVVIANPDAQKKYIEYGANFKSASDLAANTAQQVFAAAANLNGAVLWLATFAAVSSVAGINISFVAKSSAPANPQDGDVLVSPDNVSIVSGTSYHSGGKLLTPVFIPSGKGLYFLSSVAITGIFSARSASYTLL